MTVIASERTSPMVLEGSDRELVEACRRGERDAFRALFEAYKDKVYSIVLRYTEGLSYEQISEVLGCSPGTVASRLNRAHKALERRLAYFVKPQGGAHV